MSVEKLQAKMLEMPQAAVETVHRFCDGCYAREISIPAGVMIVGAKHKTEHFHVISKGVLVISNMGKEEVFKAPYTGVTKPGSKRAIVAIEDSVFTTFHPTKEKDIEKIEREIIEDEGLKITNSGGRKCLG